MLVKMLLVFMVCLILTNEVTSINSPLRIVNGTEAAEGEFPYVVSCLCHKMHILLRIVIRFNCVTWGTPTFAVGP